MEQADTIDLKSIAFGRPGSNPGFDTKFRPVAELAYVPRLDRGVCGFDPHQAYQILWGVSLPR